MCRLKVTTRIRTRMRTSTLTAHETSSKTSERCMHKTTLPVLMQLCRADNHADIAMVRRKTYPHHQKQENTKTVSLPCLGSLCIHWQSHSTHHFTSFSFISFHFMSCHFISFHCMLLHFIAFHFISFHFISFHFISFRFVSFISFH